MQFPDPSTLGDSNCDFGVCGSGFLGGFSCAAECRVHNFWRNAIGIGILVAFPAIPIWEKAVDAIRQPIMQSSKPDIKTANDAWKKVKEACAAHGVTVEDHQREQWHDEPHYGDGKPGYHDLVQKGIDMFCPGASY